MVAKPPSPVSFSVHYSFSQRFDFPAKDAYEWSMDYRTDDIATMGKKGTRRIQKINDDTLVITDTIKQADGGRVRKVRLIRMYPEILMMVNTRLSEDGLHSQFVYDFVEEGKDRSRLDFTGSQVFYGEKPSPSKTKSLAKEIAEEDAQIWVVLAKAMKEDLGRSGKDVRGKARN
jgi:hypothetical protein